jgi:AcrR family transcriptional regulator
MQRPDEHKRRLIIDTAARFFATHPFHKVRLDDIAAAARLGKGTIYIYFESKEELYFALLYEGFARVLNELHAELETDSERPAVESLRTIVAKLLGYAFQNPHLAELMRSAGMVVGHSEPAWRAKRKELQQLIEDTVRRGVARGEFADAHPELTALCIQGMVRSLLLFGPEGMDEKTVSDHVVQLLTRGIAAQAEGLQSDGSQPDSSPSEAGVSVR